MAFVILGLNALRAFWLHCATGTSGPVIGQADIFNGEPFICYFVGCVVSLDLCERLEVNDRKRRESDTSASTASGKLYRFHTLLPTGFHPQYAACLHTGSWHFKIRILEILVYLDPFPVQSNSPEIGQKKYENHSAFPFQPTLHVRSDNAGRSKNCSLNYRWKIIAENFISLPIVIRHKTTKISNYTREQLMRKLLKLFSSTTL